MLSVGNICYLEPYKFKNYPQRQLPRINQIAPRAKKSKKKIREKKQKALYHSMFFYLFLSSSYFPPFAIYRTTVSG